MSTAATCHSPTFRGSDDVTEVKPEDQGGVTDAILTAIAERAPMEIVGSATMRTIGRPLATPVKLDLSGLAGLNFYEPEELVLSAKAGTRRSAIDELLRGRRQAFAFEPPDLARLLGSNQGGTLGGMIAANLSGPRRIRSGALRDHILGFSAVSGRGEAFKCGGRVMKNVTGYDLPKLMAGSWGTLCALTEVTMKVMPAPETTATLLLFGLNDEDAGAAMRDAMRSPLDIAGAAHLPVDVARASALADIANAGTSVTLLRLEGFGESVAFRLAELQARFTAERSVLDPQRSETAWSEIRDVHMLAAPRERIVWRVSLPPSDGPRAMNHIRTAAPAAIGYYDWAGGLLWVSVPLSEHGSAQVVRGAIPPATGHATLIRGPESLRASVFVFEPLPDPLAKLTQRVKQAFDPSGVLNPGRMYHFA
jgi:glycolate oxidase FAD binding subunit